MARSFNEKMEKKRQAEYIEKSPTITARCGTGGNNVPGVVYCLQGNGIDDYFKKK